MSSRDTAKTQSEMRNQNMKRSCNSTHEMLMLMFDEKTGSTLPPAGSGDDTGDTVRKRHDKR